MLVTPLFSRAVVLARKLTLIGLTAPVGLALASCGKPATVEDCEQIVARIAELELKEVDVSDQAEMRQQIQGAQAAFKDRLLTDCVGRRLRQSTLDCLKRAATAEAAVKECF